MRTDLSIPKHHEVALDYYLYSCFEFENLCKAVPAKLKDENRWLMHNPAADLGPSDSPPDALRKQLEKVARWYRERFPKLAPEFSVDYENLSEVVPALVLMSIDFDVVVNAMTGKPTPLVDRTKNEPSEVWDLLRSVVTQEFPDKADYFLNFLTWKNAELIVEEIPPGSRPPVGRFSPFFRPGRFDGPGARGRSSGPKRSSGPSSSPRPEHPRRQANASSDDRGPRRERDRSSSQASRPSAPPSEGGRDSGRKRERDPKLERESLKEVLAGVQRLNDDAALNEIRLPPANSYYRRLQHQQVKEEGMFSISDGEGADRAVVIVRHEPSDQGNHE